VVEAIMFGRRSSARQRAQRAEDGKERKEGEEKGRKGKERREEEKTAEPERSLYAVWVR
jgi:hypothetical protein